MLDVFKKIAYSFRSALRRGCRPAGENTVNIPEPVYVRDLFGGKVTIIVFGAPFNWNYAGASREEMEAKNPGITAALEEVMRKYNIRRALVPKPAFNAKVVTDVDLPNELLPTFFRGADADGVILERSGDAYFLASADCVAVALFDPQTGIAAGLHCGRNAVIDRACLDSDGETRREHESVIHAAVQALDRIAFDLPEESLLTETFDIQAFLAAGIRPETFDHPTKDPKYGTANQRMVDHLLYLQLKRGHLPSIVTDEVAGKIDLFALVRHQLDSEDVTMIEEDEFDTATSKDADGKLIFHSNRRDPTERNLVVIMRN